ncbi:MAG: hypothetical protein K1X64_03860 [Myxococcaceae bacterium]|nr:hypothetical protein [Myxococcaceae bacterium]
MRIRLGVFAATLLATTAWSADKPKKPPQKLDLGLPSFGAIPKAEGLTKPKEVNPAAQGPTVTPASATYSVVKVTHGKSFTRTAAGAQPSAPFDGVKLAGDPLVSEKFTTVVRVKCPQKVNTSIDVAILDSHGETMMEVTGGQLNFKGLKDDEVDYTVDWDPTTMSGAGEYQTLVRVGGNPMGSTPLKVIAPKPDTK